jgi:hypothetical protein
LFSSCIFFFWYIPAICTLSENCSTVSFFYASFAVARSVIRPRRRPDPNSSRNDGAPPPAASFATALSPATLAGFSAVAASRPSLRRRRIPIPRRGELKAVVVVVVVVVASAAEAAAATSPARHPVEPHRGAPGPERNGSKVRRERGKCRVREGFSCASSRACTRSPRPLAVLSAG